MTLPFSYSCGRREWVLCRVMMDASGRLTVGDLQEGLLRRAHEAAEPGLDVLAGHRACKLQRTQPSPVMVLLQFLRQPPADGPPVGPGDGLHHLRLGVLPRFSGANEFP